jgi:hypothetical protein
VIDGTGGGEVSRGAAARMADDVAAARAAAQAVRIKITIIIEIGDGV